jgi:hypothetical protein
MLQNLSSWYVIKIAVYWNIKKHLTEVHFDAAFVKYATG